MKPVYKGWHYLLPGGRYYLPVPTGCNTKRKIYAHIRSVQTLKRVPRGTKLLEVT